MNLKQAKSFLAEANNSTTKLSIEDIQVASKWFKLQTIFAKLRLYQSDLIDAINKAKPKFLLIDELFRHRLERKMVLFENKKLINNLNYEATSMSIQFKNS